MARNRISDHEPASAAIGAQPHSVPPLVTVDAVAGLLADVIWAELTARANKGDYDDN